LLISISDSVLVRAILSNLTYFGPPERPNHCMQLGGTGQHHQGSVRLWPLSSVFSARTCCASSDGTPSNRACQRMRSVRQMARVTTTHGDAQSRQRQQRRRGTAWSLLGGAGGTVVAVALLVLALATTPCTTDAKRRKEPEFKKYRFNKKSREVCV
jgi:hypothetical protein